MTYKYNTVGWGGGVARLNDFLLPPPLPPPLAADDGEDDNDGAMMVVTFLPWRSTDLPANIEGHFSAKREQSFHGTPR